MNARDQLVDVLHSIAGHELDWPVLRCQEGTDPPNKNRVCGRAARNVYGHDGDYIVLCDRCATYYFQNVRRIDPRKDWDIVALNLRDQARNALDETGDA